MLQISVILLMWLSPPFLSLGLWGSLCTVCTSEESRLEATQDLNNIWEVLYAVCYRLKCICHSRLVSHPVINMIVWGRPCRCSQIKMKPHFSDTCPNKGDLATDIQRRENLVNTHSHLWHQGGQQKKKSVTCHIQELRKDRDYQKPHRVRQASKR